MRLTDDQQHPSADPALRDYDALKKSNKALGPLVYAEALEHLHRQNLESLHVPRALPPQCEMCTQEKLETPEFDFWMRALSRGRPYHRKNWELAYVVNALFALVPSMEGKRGLGFAVGNEQLPSLFAARGAEILATDAPTEIAVATGWVDGHRQHAASLEQVFKPEMIDRAQFDLRVRHAFLDMNFIGESIRGDLGTAIPLRGHFDFCWSVCSLEHLGSIAKGRDFVRHSLKTLKPGGLAVHTMEYNVGSNDETIDNWSTVLFRRRDLEDLFDELRAEGHEVAPVSWSEGRLPLNRYIDVPPYEPANPHLRLSIDGFECTSFGIAVKKRA